MSLRILVRRGVYPAYVFSCETMPADFFSGVGTEAMHLIAFSCMSHSNLKKWRGAVSFYNWMLFQNEYQELWDYAGNGLGSIATASIITTQAAAFALGAGVRSVLLAGNDLGFVDRFYARGTCVQDRRVASMDRLSNLESFEMDIARSRRQYSITRGKRQFYTNHQFLAAKMRLEELFSGSGVPVYDCSIPGCSEKSVRKIVAGGCQTGR
jgi:hypothetical protein